MPIITEDTFEAVRKMHESSKKTFAEGSCASAENIFKGLIVCGDCGKHMTRLRRRAKFSFECYIYQSIDRDACSKKTIKEADLHTALYTFIKKEIDLAVDMSRIVADMQKRQSYKHQQSIMDKQISALKRKIEQNRHYRGSLREDLNDGVITEQDYAMMKTDYDAEKLELQASLDELVAAKEAQAETMSPDNKWIAEFRRFESEAQLSAGMVSTLIERINIYEGARVEVSLRYRDDYDSLQARVDDDKKSI